MNALAAVVVTEPPTFLESIGNEIREDVIWLGREILEIYHEMTPIIYEVAKKVFASLPGIVILQLISIKARLLCYAVALATALLATVVKINWATARIFRPFVFSFAVDLVHIAALVYRIEPFPGNIFLGSYMLAYAVLGTAIATYLEEIMPDNPPAA